MRRRAVRRVATGLLAAIVFVSASLWIEPLLFPRRTSRNTVWTNLVAASSPLTERALASAREEDRCAPFPFHPTPTDSLFSCGWRSSIPPSCSQRLRARLVCNQTSADITYDWVQADTPPSAYGFHDDCLAQVVKTRCHEGGEGGKVIPNLSHHVFFGGRELKDYTFLSVISAVRFVQPCLVMVHADVLPNGRYWDSLVRLVPHIVHVNRSAPSSIFGRKVRVIEHSSDIARLEAVKRFGGVYLDSDYLLFRPVEDLRHHTVVMGITIPNVNYANGIFMGRAGAPFLQAWYESYRTFNDSVWGFHSTILPYRLHRSRPELEFHEVSTFMQPYFKNIKKDFFDSVLDWRRLHGLHLYVRLFPRYFVGRFELRQVGSLGQVCRHLLFGDSQACLGSVPSGPVLREGVRAKPPGVWNVSSHMPLMVD